MAKTLLIRPHMVALCAYGTHLFSCRAFPYYHSTKFDRALTSVILPKKLGRQPHVGCGTKSVGLIVRSRSLTIRVTSQVDGSGSIDSPLMQSMQKKIKEHLNAEFVTVKDAYGDGRHVSIDVISSAFEGQSAMNRQRMVYKAIWEELQNTVHAVDQMTTRTPNEAAPRK